MSAPRKTIGGREYAFGTLPATVALDIEPSIIPILGAVIEELAKAGIQIETLMGIELEKLSVQDKVIILKAAIAGLKTISSVDYVEPSGKPVLGIKSVMRILFPHVTVIAPGEKGKVIGDAIDVVFTGRPRDIWAVLAFSVWENFKGFLGDGLSSSSPAEAATA